MGRATTAALSALRLRMIETFPSFAALAETAASVTTAALGDAITARGRASLVATGGRAPGPVYDRLKDAALDWGRVSVTLSDERFVPPDAPDSNARLVRERLLQRRAAGAEFVPLWRPLGDPDAAARAAEPKVRALAPFDMMLLGMGEDGHVASLIPGSPALAAGMDLASGRWLIGVPAGTGSPPLARISLTLPALLEARAILVLIAGDAKRTVVEAALAGADLPVGAVLAQDRAPVRVLWAPSHEE
jgi:6-phosphogluconolactonase